MLLGGGGEPLSQRNMAAPAALNDATAAPSRWPKPSADSAPHGTHRNCRTQVRLLRPSLVHAPFNPSPLGSKIENIGEFAADASGVSFCQVYPTLAHKSVDGE